MSDALAQLPVFAMRSDRFFRDVVLLKQRDDQLTSVAMQYPRFYELLTQPDVQVASPPPKAPPLVVDVDRKPGAGQRHGAWQFQASRCTARASLTAPCPW